MRPGTPGFSGARLRQAREMRGLTAAALAELSDVTGASISQYEKGRTSPGPEMLQRLAQLLNVPAPFLTTPMPPERPGSAIFPRCMASATATARRRAERRLELLQEVVSYLEKFVDLPAVNLPKCRFGNAPVYLRGEEIEALAVEARNFWGVGMGPISDVTLLLENNGVIVTRGLLHAETLDALSQWSGGRPYLFLAADKHSAARNRFNVGHELGHLVMHRFLPPGTLGRTDAYHLVESQAHRFAGAFLLPADTFAEEIHVPSLDVLIALKARWNVSAATMLQRMLDLEFITAEQFKRLRIAYSKRKWNKGEPLDAETPVEEPRLLSRSLDLLLVHKLQTREQMRQHIGSKLVEEITCSRPGLLSDQQPDVQIRAMPSAAAAGERRSQPQSSERPSGTSVLQFPVGRISEKL